MENEITVQVKSVYGIKKVYPICKKACIFAGISGHKTLTQPTIERIKLLGYKILVLPETLYS